MLLIFLILTLFGSHFVAGSIIDCCRQGKKAGETWEKGPACVEKNIDYTQVGLGSKSICRTVFLSCCRFTARERYCTAGVQAAINNLRCEAGVEIGGQMKLECCDCCKKGLLAGSRGQQCTPQTQQGSLCSNSFISCCTSNNLKLTNVTEVKSTSIPTTTKVKVTDCKSLGCEHECAHDDGNNYVCKCRSGYQLKSDQRSCEDIDECKGKNPACDEGSICQNQPGSYICVKDPDTKDNPCEKSGYVRENGVCVDENECLTGSANCGEEYCFNAVGYYACFQQCPYGYKAEGKICKDIDECALQANLCGVNYKCVNTVGYYNCILASCQKGYELKDGKCEDIDECLLGNHDCGKNYKCKNTIGHYKCELASCNQGFFLTNGRCADINECNLTPDICGSGRCFNNYGSYICSCFPGYQLSTTTNKCEDINECERNAGICESDCVNTIGSFKCTCPSGYQSIGDHCEDIDECSSFGRRCPSDHVCYNEYGNYSCIRTTCPNKYYILRSSYECRLMCPGNHGACSKLLIRTIKWRAVKFRKFVNPRAYKFTYVLRIASYLPVQIHFSLAGNENKEFFLQRVKENTVDVINIKKLVGPKRYTLRLNADVLYRGKVINKFVYFIYIFVSKYSF